MTRYALIFMVLVAAAGSVWWSASSSPAEASNGPQSTHERAPAVAPGGRWTATSAATTGVPAPPGNPELTPPPVESVVDLAALRRAMPDNLYWAQAAPTTDERVLAARAAFERERSRRFGSIEAGESSEKDIDAFFEGQRQLHQDYLDFCNRVLEAYGDLLPERDRGLYELGASMHRDRLAELPSRRAQAIERRRVQDERRRRWEEARSTPR